jgi:CPA1 family monovalent cation:H+ antiporter
LGTSTITLSACPIFCRGLDFAQAGVGHLSTLQVLFLFFRQAGGDLFLGIVLGYAGYVLLRSIDYYQVELLITLAIVMGGSLLAEKLQFSEPLAMVMAGLITVDSIDDRFRRKRKRLVRHAQ